MWACERRTASISDGLGGERAVDLFGFGAAALEEPAVEQQLLAAVQLDEVHGAGDGAGGAPEREFHRRGRRVDEAGDRNLHARPESHSARPTEAERARTG